MSVTVCISIVNEYSYGNWIITICIAISFFNFPKLGFSVFVQSGNFEENITK